MSQKNTGFLIVFFFFSFGLIAEAGIRSTKIDLERPATLKLPKGVSSTEKVPLVVLLHGIGFNASLQDLYLGLSRGIKKHGYALLLPNGTKNSDGERFWHATNECCGGDKSVDDKAYLKELIDKVSHEYPIDQKRIYIVGHSNGGFMAYTMACEYSELISGVVSLAGSTFAEMNECAPTHPVSVLQVHGTDDQTVPYSGEGRAYPGVREVIDRWIDYNSCDVNDKNLSTKDLVFFNFRVETDRERNISIDFELRDLFKYNWQDETVVEEWNRCQGDSRVGLWSITDATHAPTFNGTFVKNIWRFLERN